jgi:7-carboxy-7-deazaguanine synthase
MNIPVNEIFHSIQGEGSYTGTPAIFVRLQYCQIGCGFCDTKHTWKKNDLDRISFDEMMAKVVDAPTWADVSILTLIDYLIQQPEQLIVITGGEPCNYDLTELTTSLLLNGKQPQIETSGTLEVRAHENTFVTVSPKINMPGGLKFINDIVYRADEIKMPVGKMSDVEALVDILEHCKVAPPKVYLQPLSQSEKATELCIEQARLNGWRLSAQLHKYLKVR